LVDNLSRFSKTVIELRMRERKIRDMKSRVREETMIFKEKASELKSELERLEKQFDQSDNFDEQDPLVQSEPDVVELCRINKRFSSDCSQKRTYDHEQPPGKRKLIHGCYEEVNFKKSKFIPSPITVIID
jgi:hypothetical protein